MSMKLVSAALFASVAGLSLSACATPEPVTETDIATALPGWERTGDTQSCLSLVRLDEIEPVTERIWLFEMRDGTTYLNVVSSGCNDADSSFTYLQYETTINQLCANEIVRVFDQASNMLSGSCGLNDFERVTPR